MSLFGDVRELRKERKREMELLHTRIVTIADAIESEPGKWVGEHPYAAMAGAAAAGFIAAQLPSAAKAAPAKPVKVAVAAPAAAPPAPAPAAESWRAEVLGVLVNLAMQYLQPQAGGPCEAPASLTPADAGTVVGATFPGFNAKPG